MEQAETQPKSFQAKARNFISDNLGSRSIIFVGMMGSGKTAIGKIVASALNLEFCDSDKEIVDAADLEIPEIFEKYGEPYFRSGEERVIQRLLEEGPKVISLGGGAFVSESTRNACKEKGISVWLKGDVNLLLSRVLKRPNKRPLLMTDDPKQTLIDLMKQREPIYAMADIHISSSKNSKAHTRDAVITALSQYLEETNA